MKAFVFPGQGAQFVGMGQELYTTDLKAKEIFDKANEVLGFDLTNIMFLGTDSELMQTSVTQPALFVHSAAVFTAFGNRESFEAVAGHSLGEISALFASGVLTFEEGLLLVKERAEAMQEACNLNPGTMAAVLGLDNEVVEEICNSIDDIVVPANYNCPGQLVISGTISGIEKAIEKCVEKGARRALKLPVGGAFHSPLMQPAQDRLAKAIDNTNFKVPKVPIYQNFTALKVSEPEVIKNNLKDQLTGAVKWTQIMENMIAENVTEIVEIGGNGKVLSGLFKKIDRKFPTSSL